MCSWIVSVFKFKGDKLSPSAETRARFLSPILSEVTWQVTWPRLRSQVTCGVFCLCFLKWLHKSIGPKSLGLFWNAPYCFPSDALLTSPCISVNTIVTSRVNTNSDVTECSSIATHDAHDAVTADGIAPPIYQWRQFWLPVADML